jgi:hypothetical protein
LSIGIIAILTVSQGKNPTIARTDGVEAQGFSGRRFFPSILPK